MKVLRLPRAKVQLGNPLPWNVRDETGKLLLSKGFVVDTENQLNQLLERGAFVDMEEAKAYELSRLGAAAPRRLSACWSSPPICSGSGTRQPKNFGCC